MTSNLYDIEKIEKIILYSLSIFLIDKTKIVYCLSLLNPHKINKIINFNSNNYIFKNIFKIK